MPRARTLVPALVSLLLLPLAGGAPAGAVPTRASVAAAAMSFAPPAVTMPVGGQLTFDNLDVALHNLTAAASGDDGNPLFASGSVPAGSRGNVRGVSSLPAGNYPYLCTLHPATMNGTLVVGDRLPATPGRPGAIAVPLGVASATPTSIHITDDAVLVTSFGLGTVSRLPLLPGGAVGPPTPLVTGLSSPLGVTVGPDGTLFVSDSHASTRPGRTVDGRVWAIPPEGGDVTTVGTVVVDDLPNGRHNTNGLAVHDGRLYITNGNSTDDGVNGGEPEEPLSGTLVSVPLDARGVVPGDPLLRVDAVGMRNNYDVAFRPGSDEAWMPVNGPDPFDPFGEDTLVVADTAIPPAPEPAPAPENFGFPGCIYGRSETGAPVAVDNPTLGPGSCGAHVPPVALMGLHTSSNGAAFGPAGGYFDGDLFVTQFGAFFGDPPANGHAIVRVPLDDAGAVTGEAEVVFDAPTPLDLAFGPAGLYVADFGTGLLTLIAPVPEA